MEPVLPTNPALLGSPAKNRCLVPAPVQVVLFPCGCEVPGDPVWFPLPAARQGPGFGEGGKPLRLGVPQLPGGVAQVPRPSLTWSQRLWQAGGPAGEQLLTTDSSPLPPSRPRLLKGANIPLP